MGKITKQYFGLHTPEWHEFRKHHIGGSNAAPIVGMSDYESAYSVWAEKTGKVPGFEGNMATKVGTYLEEFVAKMFEEETGKKVQRDNASITNEDYPWACANIDRLVIGEDAGLEIKTTSELSTKKFKNGEYPGNYYCQCMHYMAVTGKARWYLAVLIGNRDFKVFTIERDESEIKALMDAEKAFWEYVLKDVPPPADGHTATTEAIKKVYGKAVTHMKKQRAQKINGKYVAVIHPSVAYDLRSSDGWIEAHKYAATTELFNGEIGELHGCRFIEDTFAPVIKGDDLASDSRTLLVNGAKSGAITSIAFDGGTVAADALIGRIIEINGVNAVVTDNTTSSITFDSTDFGTIADNTVIYPGEGATGGDAAYATYFFGKEAFGIIDPEGGALQMIVHDKSEVGGPLNQFSTIGYKFETNGATILYEHCRFPEREYLLAQGFLYL